MEEQKILGAININFETYTSYSRVDDEKQKKSLKQFLMVVV